MAKIPHSRETKYRHLDSFKNWGASSPCDFTNLKMQIE